MTNLADLQISAIIILGLTSAYLINYALGRFTPRLDRQLARRADTATSKAHFLRLRRWETFISLGVAGIRVIIVIVAIITAWHFSHPTTTPIAVIGVSTLFAVLAGATLVPLLRDITAGVVMIAGHWYNVGDHVVMEPFPSMGGVVEQITLRSTKLRSVNGEVIRVHNQYIQAVRVTTAASHTLAIEAFVNDPGRGEAVMNAAFKVIPVTPTTIPQAPVITEIKQIDPQLWRITAIGEVTPYREWIIEDFAVRAIHERDRAEATPAIVHGPIVYYANPTAQKRFRHAVRARTASRTTKPPTT